MAKVNVKLLRPLNGKEIGETAQYEKADADRLAKRGAVKILPGTKKSAKPQNKAEPALDNKSLSGPVTKVQ